MEKVAIVTGASGTIGKDIVEKLVKKDIKVIAIYNKSEDSAKELKNRLLEENKDIDIYKADLTNSSEIKAMVEYVLDKYKHIDILINNAGISEYKLFTDETDEDWNKIINNNLYSAFKTTQLVVPNMISNKSGCIINISSIWGITGGAMEVLYSISKSGMDGMTKALAKELGPCNIRVNSIAPGIIDTKMNSRLSVNEIEEIKNEIPLCKIGKTEDIVRCIEWIIDDKYTTGQIISINGGWFIG